MKSSGQLLFLGTGGSMGVPVVCCSCSVCTSTSRYNKRKRPSVFCTINDTNILIDCGPDFREQALRYDINKIDALLFTHSHNDHTIGIDDLKMYGLRAKKPIPCFLSEETAQDLKERFPYIFKENITSEGLITRLSLQPFKETEGHIFVNGINIRYFSYEQMKLSVNGFRLGDLAYVSDIKEYKETILDELKGVKTLILSALRFEASPMHFNIDEAVAFARLVGAEKTWFMHIAHELDHAKGNASLPKNIRLAYDGLKIPFEADIIEENRSLNFFKTP